MKSVYKKLALFVLSLIMVLTFTSCGVFTKHGDALYDTMENLIRSQKDIDKKIEKELKNKKNTFDSPLVIENPYFVSPLTAIIIFSTDEETPIEMTVNERYHISFESSKQHALPVYGMYDDYDNKIVLKDSSGNSKTVNIKTAKYKGGVMTVEKSKVEPSDEFYLVSPDYEKTSAYDETGKLLWYLDTPDNEGAIIFLGGDRFLISDPYQGAGGIRINYSGFMEIDYLGRVHNLYIGEYGYHHEIVLMDGGKEFLLPGHDEDSPYMQGIVYSVDEKTMDITSFIDFYQVFHNIAPEWTDSYLNKNGKFNYVINCVDYDEKSGDILVSVRSTGMVVRINLKSAEIKWIFADPKNVPDELKGYLLTPTDNTRYPYGQHAAQFMEDGRIAYHNNDVDFLDTDLSLKVYKEHYSSSEIMVVNEDSLTVRTEWTYDDNTDIISRMSGSLEFIENNHKLVSYGSAFRKSSHLGEEDILVSDFKYTTGLMEELDDKDNVIWQATFPSVIHKVYKSTFYGTDSSGALKASNYTFEDFESHNGQDPSKHLGETVDIKPFRSELLNAKKLEDSFYVRINRALLNYKYEEQDEIKILFVDKSEKGTMFSYKNPGVDLPIVNSDMYGIRVNGLTGQQKVYINISGTWYDTGKIYEFTF